MAISDAELVAQALGGSEAAYAEIVRRFERPLYSLILRLVRDPALAEDLAQDVFVKAIRALASYDPERKFSSWLFKIAHNTTIDHLRRRSLDTQPLETGTDESIDPLQVIADESIADPEAEMHRRELAVALDRAVAGLRPEYREVMLLRFREGLAYEEIAAITGLPLGTVKTHIHRARKEMAEAMEKAGWGR
ncbi:MAG: sigma-70 family RNA polymerase sigma factor [Acidobacteriota bacterium]